ncbi:hypothetical protein QBC38DRAFT_482429 [Podospora fimiseda]|uniref:NACHT domain-containing protein n=1 Tax=Podospora fimiseda TaxID=252190 RepID=A0AAN7BLS0_9PEZI|nr:hypothetical protein QBC38DRAFT_482429 [Podospora fimiseda]
MCFVAPSILFLYFRPNMEPLSALGIAAAVVQFLDYATKKCRTVQHLYNEGEGALFKEIAFEQVAGDLVEFSSLLRSRSRFGNADNDEAIDNIVDNCVNIANRLSGRFTKLAALRQAAGENLVRKAVALMKAAWKSEDIEYEMDQLAAYQRQLSLRMLYHLNTTAEAQNQRFDAVESKIVEVMVVAGDKLDSILRQGAALHRRLDEVETRGILEGNKPVTVVLKLENGDTKVIEPPRDDPPRFRSHRQVLMTLTSDSETKPATAQVEDFIPIQQAVLHSLYFRRVSDRYDGVKAAHAKTYEWVFGESKPTNTEADALWSPLLPWLESGMGCYWVNGKAGSGKSTLLKFIAQHKQTLGALNRWVKGNGSHLIRASFFFWNLGTELQKTRAGLLRALLYDILGTRPHLISVVMPELWTALARSRGALESPSDSELLKWFHRLLAQASQTSRFFFLIDGIDEFEGDHIDLANTIIESSKDPNIKFLISSRPLPSCVHSFSCFPALKLQDLTQGDIRRYAQDHLHAELERRYGESHRDQVITQIVDKSSGVFLWVVLVVRSLLVGLHNWDDFDELLLRLEELPSDLKDLYAHMFGKLTAGYRQEASQIFQLCLLALDKQNDPRLFPPRQLHFAQTTTYDEVQTSFLPYSKEEDARICESVAGRLRSRCSGLIEMRSTAREMKDYTESTLQHVSIEFIHRSAVEFLRLPEVVSGLFSLTEGSSFNPVLRMFRSCLLLSKTLDEKIKKSDSLVQFFTSCALEYSSLAEEAGTAVPSMHLFELDKTFRHHLGRYIMPNAAPHLIYMSLLRSNKKLMESATLYGLALQRGLVTFMRESPPSIHDPRFSLTMSMQSVGLFEAQQKALRATTQATRLLYDAVNSLLFLKPWPRGKGAVLGTRCATICNLLLAQGADPNFRFDPTYKSPWDLMLDFATYSAQHKQDFHSDFQQRGVAYLYSQLLMTFLNHGANTNALVARRNLNDPGYFLERNNTSMYGSVLEALDFIYSRIETLGDSRDPWRSGNQVANYPQELEDFHRLIVQTVQDMENKKGLKGGRTEKLLAAVSSKSRFGFKKIGKAISNLKNG